MATCLYSEQVSRQLPAVIRGTEIHDQRVVLTGHLNEGPFAANDDASGCANVLEIARALKKMIDEGRLPRPRRDIYFWWTTEIVAEEQYFSDHPDERRRFLANINQDMVGAKQSAGSRVQFVTRPPFSRASFLGDVVESIVEMLVDGNTVYLATNEARQFQPTITNSASPGGEDFPRFNRPIMSRLGTRERYDARVIPFHNASDHQSFNMGIIGIPAVTFTNWPDDYIHSTADDLGQIDPTQLQRNAVAVAASALYLANAGDGQVPALSTHIYGRALERMSRDATTAMGMIAVAVPGERSASYARAANLVRQSARRERMALDSLRVFATTGGPGERVLTGVAGQLPTEAAVDARLAVFYEVLTGQKAPQAPTTALEQKLGMNVACVVDSVKGFIAGQNKLERAKLHSLMAYETLNFVNCSRSYVDIYHAVLAEADSAGEWYYGPVTLEAVANHLEAAEKAGMISVKTKVLKTMP